MAESKYHTTKDGRRAKKGLYYYMNRKKKRGTFSKDGDTRERTDTQPGRGLDRKTPDFDGAPRRDDRTKSPHLQASN